MRAARAELGCLIALSVVWWPLIGLCVVLYAVLVTMPKEPFVSNFVLATGPALLLGYQLIGRISWEIPAEKRSNLLFVLRQYLRVAPLFLSVLFINLCVAYSLQWAWEWHTDLRLALIHVWTVVASALTTASLYVLWRLWRLPMFSANQVSSSEP